MIANASGRRVVEPGELAGRFLRQPIAEDGILVWRETWSAGDASGGGSFETLFGDRLGPRELLRALDRRGHDPRSLAFLDIETCGLGDLPIFLLGLLSFSGDRWELLQAFAPEPGKERRVLRRAIDVLVSRPVWVTFNGRSFDVPRLRARADRHELDFPEPREHIDLLHAVRRGIGSRLPNARLGTVERHFLGRERSDEDVAGKEVPLRYHDFVETGAARWLEPVIEHNRRDVASLAVIFALLAEEAAKDS